MHGRSGKQDLTQNHLDFVAGPPPSVLDLLLLRTESLLGSAWVVPLVAALSGE